MSKLIDLTGQRFGRLTVLERAANDERGQARWLCQCSCGNKTTVNGKSLRKGITKSCGCLHREQMTHHNGSYTRLYRIWHGMKDRCTCPNSKHYRNYGARGITICDAWKNDFAVFRDWALSHGYTDSLTIDRINNDGNYCPENCRWITMKDQAQNRRPKRTLKTE